MQRTKTEHLRILSHMQEDNVNNVTYIFWKKTVQAMNCNPAGSMIYFYGQ